MKRALSAIVALAALTAHGQSLARPEDSAATTAPVALAAPVPPVNPLDPASAAPVPADTVDYYTPMTVYQKFAWTVGCVVDPKWILYSGARAALDQWRQDPPTWALGARGYARRFAAAHELEAFEDTVWFAGDALNHEDPRYLRSGRTGFFPRLADALKVGMLSRRDNGSVGFSYARSVAGLGTDMFTRLVFPNEDPFTPKYMLFDVLRYVALREAQSVAREFLPDLLKGDASKAVRNLGLPLTAPTRPKQP